MSRQNRHNLQRNGEILLRQRISYLNGRGNPIIFFSEKELKKSQICEDVSYSYSRFYTGILGDRMVFLRRVRHKFEVEVVIMSNIYHRNVVRLLGCCLETEPPILVYEYIPNCSRLQECISDQMLPWSDRLRIATEVAEALNYLHTHLPSAIIHRDIKSSIILLDEHRTAKITGFDLLLPMPTGKTIVENEPIAGTVGYADPEYVRTGDLNEKSDVYSYGVVLIELLTGKKPRARPDDDNYDDNNVHNYLAELFISRFNEGRVADILEARVVKEGGTEQIQAFTEITKKCIRERREDRPTMKEVVQELWEIRKKWPLKDEQPFQG